MIKIRFGTFSFDKITKGVKANLFDKLSHFGGTAGLFNGFSIICVFEFLAFGIIFLMEICSRKKAKKSNVVTVTEFQPNENMNQKLDNMFEIMNKKIDDINQKLRELNMKVDNEKEAVEKALKKITEKIDVKMH